MMQIELRDGVRVAVVGDIEHQLPALSKNATVNAWHNGTEYKVICVPSDQPEPIPADPSFKKIATLELPFSEEAQRIEQLQIARDEKKAKIELIASNAFAQPVEVDGIMWRGGQNSASSIMSDISLSEQLGQTTTTLRDAERKPHIYSLEAAKVVAATIGLTYRQQWQAEEDALQALSEINLTDPDAIDQINAITLEI